MQHAGARRYDYGLRINKSLAMEPRICGLPLAQVRTDGLRPAHIQFVTRNVTVALLKCYS